MLSGYVSDVICKISHFSELSQNYICQSHFKALGSTIEKRKTYPERAVLVGSGVSTFSFVRQLFCDY